MIDQAALSGILQDTGKTYAEIAEATNLSQRSIEAYATGERNISLHTFVRLCRDLKLDPAEAFEQMERASYSSTGTTDIKLTDFGAVLDLLRKSDGTIGEALYALTDTLN